MINYPEMSLTPPEPEEIGFCPVCGGEIYEGDECWEKDRELICLRHLDTIMADYLDYRRKEAQ